MPTPSNSPEETVEIAKRWEAEVESSMSLEIKLSLDAYLPQILDMLEKTGLGDVELEVMEKMTVHLQAWVSFHMRQRCGEGSVTHDQHEVGDAMFTAGMRQWVGVLAAMRHRRDTEAAGGSVVDLEALFAAPAAGAEDGDVDE